MNVTGTSGSSVGSWKLIKRSMKGTVGYGRSVFMTVSSQPNIDAEVIVGTGNSIAYLFYYKAGVWIHNNNDGSGNTLACPLNCNDPNNMCKNAVAMISGHIVCSSPDTSK